MYTREEILGHKAAWREYAKGAPAANPFAIGLAASFTVEPLEPFLGAELIARGFAPEIRLAPYGQLVQACLDPAAAFGTISLKAVCMLWRIEDLAARELRDWIGGSRDAFESAAATLRGLGAAIGTLQQVSAAPILVSMPPYPDLPECSPIALDGPWTVASFYRQLCQAWADTLAALPGVHVVDLDSLQRWFGFEASHDPRKRYLYRQPYSEGFLLAIAKQIGHMLHTIYQPQRKCIAVDCDNTLWGGIVGEDGLQGISLGDEFPGSAYADLQRILLHWKRQGVLLALLSKNNEPEVWDVFDHHDGMVLQRSDIAAWRIDWNPKPGNLAQIAAELNIGADSFVFLDDNPVEIEAMRAALPEVESVLLSEEPADIVGHLKSLRLFERLALSAEDRERTAMIGQERERAGLRNAMSREEFLESLELSVDVFQPDIEHIGRVAQLINKTNQFNLTTVRRTEDEVRALLASEDYAVYAARVADRFGDYGLTGLVILNRLGEGEWNLDTFLMSCRVLGRGVETALMAVVAEDAKRRGAQRLYGQYLKTDRNAPTESLLPSHGFVSNGSAKLVLDPAAAPPVPAYIKATLR